MSHSDFLSNSSIIHLMLLISLTITLPPFIPGSYGEVQSPATVRVWSSTYGSSNVTNTSLVPGSHLEFEINVVDAPLFSGFHFWLYYDPSVLNATSVDFGPGTVFPYPFVFIERLLPSGAIRLGAVDSGGGGYGGRDGTLAKINFEVLSSGVSSIALAAGTSMPSQHAEEWTELIYSSYHIDVTTSDGYFRNVQGKLGPIPNFMIMPVPQTAGRAVTFDASYSFDPDSAGGTSTGIVSYVWSFGDGSNTTAMTPIVTHTFVSSLGDYITGNFSARLTIVDADNFRGIRSKLAAVAVHPDIVIRSDQDFTRDNCVTGGDGSISGPYMIESCLTVNLSVEETDSHFLIQNVQAESTSLVSVANGSMKGLRANLVSIGSSRNVLVADSDMRGLSINQSSMVRVELNHILPSDGTPNDCETVHVSGSSNVTFANNEITPFYHPIPEVCVDSSNRVTFAGNKAGGLLLRSTSLVSMTGNSLAFGIGIEGDTEDSFASHTITPDNSAGGKPLYFYNNCNNLQVDKLVIGQLIAVNCTGFRATNLDIRNITSGILFAFVKDSLIEHNTINIWRFGISVLFSTNVTISENQLSSTRGTPSKDGIFVSHSASIGIMHNEISKANTAVRVVDSKDIVLTDNSMSDANGALGLIRSKSYRIEGNELRLSGIGFSLVASNNGTVTGNIISNNYNGFGIFNVTKVTVLSNLVSENGIPGFSTYGIGIHYSADLRITTNNITRNTQYGVYFEGSLGCRQPENGQCIPSTRVFLHHNNIVNNVVQVGEAYNSAGENYWDNGKAGNYWSDYVGQDSDGDGIGDISYIIDSDTQDRFPLITLYTLENAAPLASLAVSPSLGNVTTDFLVDASSSSDDIDSSDTLEVRWDWENDGVWDTAWSTSKTGSHRYSLPGNYTIRIQVRDTYGNMSSTTRGVVVQMAEPPPDTAQSSPLSPAWWQEYWYVIGILAGAGLFTATLFALKRRKTHGSANTL